MCISCASMRAVLNRYTGGGCAYDAPACCAGTGVLIMCQHARTSERMRWSECAWRVPACAHGRADTLARVRLSCASMRAVLSTGAGTLERVCLSCVLTGYAGAGVLPCACMCAVLSGGTGAGVLSIRHHVRSAERIHWSGCLSDSMCAVLSGCAGARALVMPACAHC